VFGAAKGGGNGMRLKIQIAATLLVIFLFCQVGMGAKDDNKSEPYNYFRDYVGLNAEQIQSINNGKALAKVLDTGSADQILVFGAVYINSTPEKYLKFASDIDALRILPSYNAIREVGGIVGIYLSIPLMVVIRVIFEKCIALRAQPESELSIGEGSASA
jgi:hypothetical protein